MSYFSTALTRLAERAGLNQADVVRAAGLTRSHVSRVFTAEQRVVSDEDFTALLGVFKLPIERAELVMARCMDARIGPGAELVEISIKMEGVGTMKERPTVELSAETEKAFAWLRSQCPLNPELEKHLVGYARITGMK